MKLKYRAGLVCLTLTAVLIFAAGCGRSAGGDYVRLSAEEAKERMKENRDAIILDVRTEEEFNETHIPGAVLLPNEEIGEEMPALLPDKDAEILIYCRSGNRSEKAARKLLDLGYTNVFDFGGINDWPYDTVTGEEEGAGVNTDPSFANFKAEDLEGEPVDSAIWADSKLTMVNVWATFCTPCLDEMPDLGEINREYDDAEFQIVGIVSDVLNQDMSVSPEMLATAREIVEITEADYRHVVPSEDLLYAGIASIRAVPFTFFLDGEGNLVGNTYSGSKSKSDWEKIIEAELKEMQ